MQGKTLAKQPFDLQTIINTSHIPMVSHCKPGVCNLGEARKATVLSAGGKAISFGSLLDQQSLDVNRTLVVFIRHFFCGNCQEYVRRLSTELAPSRLPKDLSIIVIGCGAPSLIPSYLDVTACPFHIYADPSTQLYKLLGMQKSLSLGSKDPEYIQHSLASGVVKSIVQGLKRIPSGDFGKGGDLSVNGGEFLFARDNSESEWNVSWSHCMMNSRDHTEVDLLQYRLGLIDKSQLDTLNTETGMAPAMLEGPPICQKSLVCGQAAGALRISASNRRRSWMVKANHLSRSSSIRRSTVHVS